MTKKIKSEITPEELKQIPQDETNNQKINYDKIEEENLNVIDDLQELYPHWPRTNIVKKIKKTVDGKDIRFVAKKNGKIIAHLKVDFGTNSHKHVADFSSLKISSIEKGQGIDAGLIEYTISKLPKKITLLKTSIDIRNKETIALYEKLGFKEHGKLKKASIINGKYVDNLLMSKFIEKR